MGDLERLVKQGAAKELARHFVVVVRTTVRKCLSQTRPLADENHG